MNTPAPRARRKVPLTAIAAVSSIALAAWWALAPTASSSSAPVEELDAAALEPPPPPRAAMIEPVDVAAFRLPVWMLPPEPAREETADAPTPPSPPPTIPPFQMQLLAIVRELDADGLRYRAILYDPQSDRIVTAVEGQAIGPRVVESVDAGSLVLRGPGRTGPCTLALSDQAPPEGVR